MEASKPGPAEQENQFSLVSERVKFQQKEDRKQKELKKALELISQSQLASLSPNVRTDHEYEQQLFQVESVNDLLEKVHAYKMDSQYNYKS